MKQKLSIGRINKLISLLGVRQAFQVGKQFAFRNKTPLPLRIEGIDTPLWCRIHDSDLSVLWQIFGLRWFDHAKLGNGSDKQPQLIIDGGAYCGYSTVFFANAFPDATIIAIEPNRDNFALLLENCASYPNVRALNAAVWDGDALLQIENPTDDSWMLRFKTADSLDTVPVEGINLSTILDESGFDTIDLLKLDIEGAERVVFGRNYKHWLGQTRNMLIELHERYMPGCEAAFNNAIADETFHQSQQGEYTVLQRPEYWNEPVNASESR